jgi:glycosyltransferase involved in cell wall biosynthesis
VTTVTCVIAAYNEEKRVGAVLDAVSSCSDISEVIVVDDGSTDATRAIVQGYGSVRLVSYAGNKGKSFAIATGIQQAQGDVILLLDADLVGLNHDVIRSLINPVIHDEVDVVMSLRDHSILFYRLIRLDFITGERVFRKSIFEQVLSEMKELPSYGLEVFMNQLVILKSATVRVIRMSGVESPRKIVKLGFWAGIIGDMQTMKHVLSVVSVYDVALQNIRLKKLMR